MNITSYIHRDVKDFIEKYNLLKFTEDKNHPIHLLFPNIMQEHINEFKEVLEKRYNFDYLIYFAKKANPAKTFSKQALKEGINIDVASKNELNDALKIGFKSKNIDCTGPKDNEYLSLAIKNNCLISCDSVSELKRIKKIKQDNESVTILLRISNPNVTYGNIALKDSRFGILTKDLPECYKLIKESKGITLKGFHIHRSEIQPQLKAEFIIEMLNQTFSARENGLYPDCINIGGAYSPLHHVEDIQDWHRYLNFLCEELKKNGDSGNWRNDFYDLTLYENQVKGLNILKQKVYSGMFNKDYLLKILEHNYANSTIGNFLEEAGISLCIEPGYNLLEQAGISIIKIIDVKEFENSYIVTCNANSSNLSSTYFESLIDPLFIPKENKNPKENNEKKVHLFGNTCSEDDILMRRPIYIEKAPQVGDLFVFINTAAYKSYFQDASPIMQEKGKFYEVKKDKEWKVTSLDDN